MISSLKWIQKGIFKEFPFLRPFDELKFNEISQKLGLELENVDSEGLELDSIDREGVDIKESIVEMDESESLGDVAGAEMVIDNVENLDENGNDFMTKYEMDTYDDEEMDELENAQEKEIDAQELEEMKIEKTDNLLVISKSEKDVSMLEVYVYEEDNLYVHHDILLSQMALTTEPIFINDECYCAVGTFNPIIEIFNVILVLIL